MTGAWIRSGKTCSVPFPLAFSVVSSSSWNGGSIDPWITDRVVQCILLHVCAPTDMFRQIGPSVIDPGTLRVVSGERSTGDSAPRVEHLHQPMTGTRRVRSPLYFFFSFLTTPISLSLFPLSPLSLLSPFLRPSLSLPRSISLPHSIRWTDDFLRESSTQPVPPRPAFISRPPHDLELNLLRHVIPLGA